MLQQNSHRTRYANSKLFRLAISGLLAAGTALGANAIGAIALKLPRTGLYIVRVNANDGQSQGRYSLTVQ